MLEPASIDHPHASLMRRFCSLGDNCELGIAQRRLGAEPADLLRWAAIDVSALLRLLADRGAALADVDKLSLSRTGDYHWVRHDGYGYGWHSLLRVGAMPQAEIPRREAVRMPRLAEALFSDLGEGERIFVLKRADPTITAGEAADVLAAMDEHGDALLLFVTPAEAGRPGGTVRPVGPRLLRGYISRFADPIHVAHDTPVDLWLQLCQAVAAQVALTA
jgi:hypothetical protein